MKPRPIPRARRRDPYLDFVGSKLAIAPTRAGVDVAEDALNEELFGFQRALVRWALATGKAALFAGCGLGKTLMQLEWALWASRTANGRALILTPLAVAQQTVREGERFGIPVVYAKDGAAAAASGERIVVTNYERLDKFDPAAFAVVVLDESGIIKNYSGQLKRKIFRASQAMRWKLACSATPAPNDHQELGQHAEFLDVLTSHEMLARWFVNDSSAFGTWRLKGHAAEAFWDWTCSWARYVGTPADLGFPADGYDLPGLEIHRHVVDVDVLADRGDELFRTPDLSATAVHREKRRSIEARAARVAELVLAEPGEPWIVWCETDYEERALREVLPGAVVLNGKDSLEEKESAVRWFLDTPVCTCRGRIREPSRSAPTCELGSRETANTSANIDEQPLITATSGVESATPTTSDSAKRRKQRSRTTSDAIQSDASHSDSSRSASPSRTTTDSSPSSAASAPSADARTATAGTVDSTSTTATGPGACADSSARTATTESASSATTRSASSWQRCTCGADRGRILISKASILGYGLNFQHCARMAFAGPTFSYERFYQAVRRCHRFGQQRPVHVHVVMGQTELAVWDTLTRKSDDHEAMAREMFAATRRATARVDDGAKAYAPRRTFALVPWVRTSEDA